MEAAMLCELRTTKRPRNRQRKPKDPTNSKKKKTKHACIVEAHESTRQRLESSLPKDHQDHIAGKGYNSLQHYNLVHKFISMPQAMKVPDASSSGQGMEEARDKSSMEF